MQRILIVVAANVLVAFGVYSASAGGAGESAYAAQLEADVVELGFQTGGRIAEISVHEGQQVKKGQVLGRLDTTELAEAERNAAMRLAGAESQIPQIETAIQLQRQNYAVDVQQADAAVAAARANLNDVRRGARPQELEQARQAHAAAQTRLENARTALARTQELYKVGSQAKRVVDDAQAAFDVATAEERSAREALALLKEGARPEVVSAAAARVREVEGGVARARLGDLLVKKLEQQMVTAKAEADSARAAYQMAITQRNYATLVAPTNGWILTEDAHTGEVVGIGGKVFTLANLDTIWAQAYVSERTAGRLKQGQNVTVTADAVPGQAFQGQISALYFQTRKDQLQRASRIRVTVANQNRALKPGMRVKILIPS
jgi:HlyD family secretion protein